MCNYCIATYYNNEFRCRLSLEIRTWLLVSRCSGIASILILKASLVIEDEQKKSKFDTWLAWLFAYSNKSQRRCKSWPFRTCSVLWSCQDTEDTYRPTFTPKSSCCRQTVPQDYFLLSNACHCLYSPRPLEVGEKAETRDRVPRTKRESVDMLISSWTVPWNTNNLFPSRRQKNNLSSDWWT